ncbi:MAG: glutathione S-transferase family protein [Burkholderiales bacterium]|nr:glutathione S-transferase family protein [Burkholderiales bacterium]MDG1226269.1 glutathione S-transferase family protein [Burkholderiales bacterium]MDG2203072.1 glutathione S-transferase family protein [Burkholderiales bacterium]
MELLLDPRTINSRKVLAGCKLVGAEYTLNRLDYFQAEQTSPAYLAINPMASMPALKDGNFTLWESNAILQYAAEKVGNTSAYPTDLQTRADVNRWLLWESSSWFGSCYKYVVENCVKPLLGGETDQSILDAEEPNFHKLAGILDARLAGSRYMCGDQPTIADVAIAAPMHIHGYFKLPLSEHPNLVRWMTQDVEKQSWWIDTTVLENFVLPEAS